MSVQLNHTIVWVHDKAESASFYAEILGLSSAVPSGPFLAVAVANGVTLDFADSGDRRPPEHYAFLVSEGEFDEILGRIQQRKLPFWADPFHQRSGQINTDDGGRGVYWEDPDGNNLEILTKPYGSGPTA